MGIVNKLRGGGDSGRGDDPGNKGNTTPTHDPITAHMEWRTEKLLKEKGVLTGDDLMKLGRIERNLRQGRK